MSELQVKASKDGPSRLLQTSTVERNSYARLVTENNKLLTELSRVCFQILILDKHSIGKSPQEKTILYQYATPSFTNPDEARQSVLSSVEANKCQTTGSIGFHSYKRFVLVVVHQLADEKLVSNHTNYLVELFKMENKDLDTWYGEVKREDFKEKLGTFLKRHIDSIVGRKKTHESTKAKRTEGQLRK